MLRFVQVDPLDEDGLRRALITAAVACLFSVIAPAYALLIWLFEKPPLTYYALALEALFTAVASLLMLRRGFSRGAAWVLLSGGGLAVLIPFLREGASSQAAGNFTIIAVMAALLVGWRGVLAVGVPSTVLIVALGYAAEHGYYHAQPPSSFRGVFALMQLLSLTVMLVIFDRVRLGILNAQHELEQKLLQAQRLEAVGRLAGGIAHDFNNLLTVILANAGILSEAVKPAPARPELYEIRAAADRAAQLTRQLLAFSRRQKLEPRVFDLVALLREEQAMLRRLIPESVRLELSCPEQPLWIFADPGQISQVILNLAVNARDAMPNGGVLEFDAARSDGAAVGAQRSYVRLRVSDSGHGMDKSTLERAFEPFFTTKGPSAGTGLGLATVHGIVAQSGGLVRVTSEPERGTTFSIFLPESEVAGSEEQNVSGRFSQRSLKPCTILLLEDDDSVRAATARVLRTLGHGVIECAGVSSARERFRAGAADIDLIVSDVVLTESSGPRLIEELLGIRASARAVRVRLPRRSAQAPAARARGLLAQALHPPRARGQATGSPSWAALAGALKPARYFGGVSSEAQPNTTSTLSAASCWTCLHVSAHSKISRFVVSCQPLLHGNESSRMTSSLLPPELRMTLILFGSMVWPEGGGGKVYVQGAIWPVTLARPFDKAVLKFGAVVISMWQ
ncbi:MAG: ATP-binding protein [Polyangiaceae bacterium]